jgi:apolipoprotein N-acyltransferase
MLFKGNKWFLAFLSAVLLSLSWQKHWAVLAFFAWVPLLLLEDTVISSDEKRSRMKIFLWSYPVFLVWNVCVSWWVWFASAGGSLMAFFANALLMSIVFVIYSALKKSLKVNGGAWIMVPLWTAFQYGHSVWDLAWIWMDLGNVFCYTPGWIQWYEFTGASGGTVWVLSVNVAIYSLIRKEAKGWKEWSKPALLLLLPLLFSYIILWTRDPLSGNEKKIVVVQPNIDPYNEKFSLDYESQFLKTLNLLRGKIDTETDYLVLPETFITGLEWFGVNENNVINSTEVIWFRDSLLAKFTKLKIVVGASSYVVYDDASKATVTSRKDRSGTYYDCFNTGMQIDKSGVQLYHKSKLVPGVERMPFPALLKPLEELAIDMGGTSGSLGTQMERMNFYDENKKCGVAPVICYESIFSEYVSDYIRKGASFIFIITNDGWWGDTPGHVQHLNYARLRAIENRRQLARSANTGISCFIDEFGNIDQPTEYWKEAVISARLVPNEKLTFFSRFGDLVSRSGSLISLALIGFSLWKRFSPSKGI